MDHPKSHTREAWTVVCLRVASGALALMGVTYLLDVLGIGRFSRRIGDFGLRMGDLYEGLAVCGAFLLAAAVVWWISAPLTRWIWHDEILVAFPDPAARATLQEILVSLLASFGVLVAAFPAGRLAELAVAWYLLKTDPGGPYRPLDNLETILGALALQVIFGVWLVARARFLVGLIHRLWLRRPDPRGPYGSPGGNP